MRIKKEIRVSQDDSPNAVAEKFAALFNEFGIQCVDTTPDSEEHVYQIELDVEVMEFDPDEHHHCEDPNCGHQH